ncbi:hypothetical protein JHK86_005747 [Glycine max]|nr:hypothetical protein JHK86_005747 [Glycine max]
MAHLVPSTDMKSATNIKLNSTADENGLSHEKKFVCAVQIPTADGILQMSGDEKSRVKDSENSAASLMIHNYL